MGGSSGKRFLEDGLAEAGGALEIGGDDGFQFVDDAEAAFYFRYDTFLFGERRQRN